MTYIITYLKVLETSLTIRRLSPARPALFPYALLFSPDQAGNPLRPKASLGYSIGRPGSGTGGSTHSSTPYFVAMLLSSNTF
ncbi:hypothetical protein GQ457_05G026230 [Hibiscus cannabinus]